MALEGKKSLGMTLDYDETMYKFINHYNILQDISQPFKMEKMKTMRKWSLNFSRNSFNPTMPLIKCNTHDTILAIINLSNTNVLQNLIDDFT